MNMNTIWPVNLSPERARYDSPGQRPGFRRAEKQKPCRGGTSHAACAAPTGLETHHHRDTQGVALGCHRTALQAFRIDVALDRAELAACTALANTLLNFDEAVFKR